MGEITALHLGQVDARLDSPFDIMIDGSITKVKQACLDSDLDFRIHRIAGRNQMAHRLNRVRY